LKKQRAGCLSQPNVWDPGDAHVNDVALGAIATDMIDRFAVEVGTMGRIVGDNAYPAPAIALRKRSFSIQHPANGRVTHKHQIGCETKEQRTEKDQAQFHHDRQRDWNQQCLQKKNDRQVNEVQPIGSVSAELEPGVRASQKTLSQQQHG
jgi:hypothetical protein